MLVACKDWVLLKVHSPFDVCEKERARARTETESGGGGIKQPAFLCAQVFVFVNSASLGIFRCLSVCEGQSIPSRLTKDENV